MVTVLIAALLVTVVAPVAVWALRRRGVLDVPGSRTLHEIPTPRGGGLAVAPAVTIATLLSGDLSVTLLTVVLCALALGVIGFVDDIRGLPALPRLGAQVVAGLAVAIVVSEGVVPLPVKREGADVGIRGCDREPDLAAGEADRPHRPIAIG